MVLSHLSSRENHRPTDLQSSPCIHLKCIQSWHSHLLMNTNIPSGSV